MLDRWVPACPQWSVREIVAHLAGAAADFVAGNFPGPDMPLECWTAIQVAKREGRSLEELLAEWDGLAAILADRLAEGQAPEGPLINDIVTHEQDIRGAVAMPGGCDAPGYEYALARFVRFLGDRIETAGLGALALHSDEWDRIAGPGEPAASVRAPAFEIGRALAGRRSWAQIATFTWEGDGAPYQRLIPTMGPSKFDLVEESG
jgi:uncharacterized protein (TIGR03083 family)